MILPTLKPIKFRITQMMYVSEFQLTFFKIIVSFILSLYPDINFKLKSSSILINFLNDFNDLFIAKVASSANIVFFIYFNPCNILISY